VKPLADFELETVDGVPVARITGEVDASNAADLTNRLRDVADREGPGLVLDLTGVEYIDSSGLRMLLNAASDFADRDQELRVVIVPDSFTATLFETTGVSGILAVDATSDAAVGQLSAKG
jgi:anti-anti-sigma factor